MGNSYKNLVTDTKTVQIALEDFNEFLAQNDKSKINHEHVYNYNYFGAHLKLAITLEKSNRKRAAIKIYKKILSFYNKNKSVLEQNYFYHSLVLESLADNYQSLNYLEKSIFYYKQYFEFFSLKIDEQNENLKLSDFLNPFVKYYHITYQTSGDLIELDKMKIHVINYFKQKLGLKSYINTIKEAYEDVYEDYIESLKSYNSNNEERYKMFIDFYIEKEGV